MMWSSLRRQMWEGASLVTWRSNFSPSSWVLISRQWSPSNITKHQAVKTSTFFRRRRDSSWEETPPQPLVDCIMAKERSLMSLSATCSPVSSTSLASWVCHSKRQTSPYWILFFLWIRHCSFRQPRNRTWACSWVIVGQMDFSLSMRLETRRRL